MSRRLANSLCDSFLNAGLIEASVWQLEWKNGQLGDCFYWLANWLSKSCLPLWPQCEVFHVLSAPAICFSKAVPALSPIHFPSSCLSFHPILPLAFCLFSSSFFTLSYLPPPPLSLLHAFPFLLLSILYSPCSYLFVFWSAPSSFFMQATRPTSLVPSALSSISSPCPPFLFLSTSWSLLLYFLPFSPPVSCYYSLCYLIARSTPNHGALLPAVYTVHALTFSIHTLSITAVALVPSHQEKEVWGKLITNLKEVLKWNSATVGRAPTGMCVCA